MPTTHLARLANAREQTDNLFSIVKPEFLYERPIPERHRIIFYIGHLEAFDQNLFRREIPGLPQDHPELDRLFAFGIDPVGGGLPTDQPNDWPSLPEVRGYVKRVRHALDKKLESASGDSLSTFLNVAIEHRLMHAETLAYMLHQLPLEQKIQQVPSDHLSASPVVQKTIEIPAGSLTLGLSHDDGNIFGWDNEYEAHTVAVPAFAIDQYQVTNGDYLQFVAYGGYGDQTLWTAAGWNWKTENNVSHPAFWKRQNDRWFHRGMFHEVPLPLDWPVYVSHAEASAYARWAGKALPTEAQWHRAAYGTAQGSERSYPWGSDAPEARHGNFDFQRWDPAPVNDFPEGQSAFGVTGLLGNGWEWTSTLFQPFAGFEPFPFYPGYSADFFDGKHYVMKGGSPRTAACMLRRSFRNWFQPHYPYVYAGFRCVSR